MVSEGLSPQDRPDRQLELERLGRERQRLVDADRAPLKILPLKGLQKGGDAM